MQTTLYLTVEMGNEYVAILEIGNKRIVKSDFF
jgi:hypothetical protein